jgi:hypothetical protein
MGTARRLVCWAGIILPYAARVPGIPTHGVEWFEQYTTGGLPFLALISLADAICWGSVVMLSYAYRWPVSILFPSVLGLGSLAIAHGTLDLASDAQAAIGLLFIPIFSLPFVAIGWAIGFLVDRVLTKRVRHKLAVTNGDRD